MRSYLFIGVVLLGLTACMPYAVKKAPCDQMASNCGHKIKINQW